MKDRKKTINTLRTLFLCAFLDLAFFIENRYPSYEIVLKSDNTSAILRKTPAVKITDLEDSLVLAGNDFLSASDNQEIKTITEKYKYISSEKA